nr:MAG TPA: hypothetical protein [Caudoviricetes sp.]
MNPCRYGGLKAQSWSHLPAWPVFWVMLCARSILGRAYCGPGPLSRVWRPDSLAP